MKVTILGCGEAFDERLPNTSILVETAGRTILCDCGYSVPRQLWANTDANAIDLIYISHPHADHYFGLAPLLGRMWEDGRERPLTILSQPVVLDQLQSLAELGYRGLPARYKYPITWVLASPGRKVEWHGAEFDFAQTSHSVTNLAVRIADAGATVCYSGDGMFTPASRDLFRGADLVIHEAFQFETSPVHADIPSLLAMAPAEGIKARALVHVQRGIRRQPERLHDAIAAFRTVSLPEPLAVYIPGA